MLGCGFAGSAVAAQLDAHFDVTVVSRHEEFVHYIGGLRAAVVPGFEKKITIPLDNLLVPAEGRGSSQGIQHARLRSHTVLGFCLHC